MAPERLQPGASAGQPGRAQRAALGHGHHVDRQTGGVGQGLHPGLVAHAAPGGHDAAGLDLAQVEQVAGGEPRRLVGRPPDRGGVHADVEVVQRGPPVRIVEGHPLAAQVGLPHRHPGQVVGRRAERATVVDRRPSRRSTQFRNRPPALEGPPISDLARRGVGHGPQAVGPRASRG